MLPIPPIPPISQLFHIHVLENNSFELEGWRFIGCALRTHFRLTDDFDEALGAAVASKDHGT